MTSQPWLTIATVVKDDPEGLSRTLASIKTQDLTGVEIVIVDSSKDADRTKAQIRESGLDQAAQLDTNGTSSNLHWCEPQGIYPAMNTALEISRGEYIYFLNAGDEFFDSDAVISIREMAEKSPTWFYGQVCFVDEKGRETTPAPFDYARERASSFSNGRFPPHQGTVARRTDLISLGGFDTSFAIAADYALFLKLSVAGQPLETPATLARFFTGGLSSTAWKASLAEFHRARREILPMSARERASEGVRTLRTHLVMSLARLKP